MHNTGAGALVCSENQFKIMSAQNWDTDAAGRLLQEQGMEPLYDAILAEMPLNANILDVGSGAGGFCGHAQAAGYAALGVDYAQSIIDLATKRFADIPFRQGDFNQLPLRNHQFDVVVGINSFQYAQDLGRALREARRVTSPVGRLIIGAWGPMADCDARCYFEAYAALQGQALNPAVVPFNFAEPSTAVQLLVAGGWQVTKHTAVHCTRRYPDMSQALRGILSTGPGQQALAANPATTETIRQVLKPYVQSDGRVALRNVYWVYVAEQV